MLKKIAVACAVFAATSTVALAGAAPYVGIGVGADSAKFNVKSTDTVGPITGTTNTDYGDTGVLGNAFVGFGGTVAQNIYLGGEVFADVSSANAEDKSTLDFGSGNTLTQKTDLKRTYSYGVSVIPGVFVADKTMLYGRVGVLRGHFNLKTTTTGTGSFNPNETWQASKNENETGAQFGAGLQTSVAGMPNLSLRAEYDFVDYNDIKLHDALGGTTKISPTTNQVIGSLVWCFS